MVPAGEESGGGGVAGRRVERARGARACVGRAQWRSAGGVRSGVERAGAAAAAAAPRVCGLRFFFRCAYIACRERGGCPVVRGAALTRVPRVSLRRVGVKGFDAGGVCVFSEGVVAAVLVVGGFDLFS